MNRPVRRLEQIERWMQAVVTHPGGVEAGVRSPAAQGEIPLAPQDLESVVLPSRRRSSIQRLEVYANAYYARLLECMRDLFPVLAGSIGQEAFGQFVMGYLQEHPPRSYTLGRLADRFVTFLEETRPPSSPEEEDADWPDFVIDLARLEWSIDEVFDGPGMENDPPTVAAQLPLLSPEAWSAARLAPAPCLRLLRFTHPVNDYFTAFRKGENPAFPGPQETFLALTRREYVVRRIPLTGTQFAVLESLAGGAAIGEAILPAAEATDDWDQLAADLRQWFAIWGAEGLFHHVLTDPAAGGGGIGQ